MMRDQRQLDEAIELIFKRFKNDSENNRSLRLRVNELEDQVKKLSDVIQLEQKILLQQKQHLTLEEFCLYTDYKKEYVYKLSSEGKLPRLISGKGEKMMFLRKTVDKWLCRKNKRRGQ